MATRKMKSNDSLARHELQKAVRFIEELSWLFQSNKDLDLGTVSKALKDASEQKFTTVDFSAKASPNPDVHQLVGMLPIILRDESIFPTNGTIADFAATALKMAMTRWEKKSRFELIGEIVCNTIDLDFNELTKLVGALSILAGGDSDALQIVKNGQVSKRSWNEIIQDLLIQQR